MRMKKPPPVLQVNINRFGFGDDGSMRKINSRCDFGETLDFDKILESSDSHQLSQKAYIEDGGRNFYHLHAILCHSGTLNSGHYFCYIKERIPSDPDNPYDDGSWVKYNDMTVSKVFKHIALGQG